MIALISPTEPDGNWTRLCNQVIGTVPLESIGIFQTLASFKERINQGKTDISAIVFFAANRQELMALKSLHERVSDVKIILVLPDMDQETTRIGHTFCPRYISHTHSTFEDVAAVLNKMIVNAPMPSLVSGG